MNESASDVLLIKATMDAEVAQYHRMDLPHTLREALIEQVLLHHMEQASQLLSRVLKHYSPTEN